MSPNLGQGYIIDSFLVVVFGGVGNLWGTLAGALTLGIANKFLEPFAGAVLGKIIHSRCCHPVHSEKAAWSLCAERPLGGRMIVGNGIFSRSAVCFWQCLADCGSRSTGVQSRSLPPDIALHVPDYRGDIARQIFVLMRCLRLAVDLVWGFCGILSLGHGAFFALGGYAMGMYMMRQIGARGVYGNAELPDFMVFLNWKVLALVLAWL